ncbi:hypothetical protein CRE_01597 [Caenorhabditis remanei]|uniref:Uncharacterized protein n=1 Tax=Caenorhabditis remanei TaxID=31234 RepID=E3LGP5_CAERE|nr:hypothetical protein CRE_01597 [Caenorhabditis remanei]
MLHSINDHSILANSETDPVKLFDFGKSSKPIWITPVLDRIKAVEDVGQFNFCVIADSKVLLMVLVKRKCRKIDMKANEKCVGVLSGNAKAPCYMVLKDERKKDIVIRPATETTETKRTHQHCIVDSKMNCAACDGKGQVIIQYGNTSQNEFAVEAKKLKDRNRKRREKEIENEQLQMALRVEERHAKMIEDVKCLKIKNKKFFTSEKFSEVKLGVEPPATKRPNCFRRKHMEHRPTCFLLESWRMRCLNQDFGSVLKSEWLFDLEGKTEREEIERILSEHL